MTIQNLIVTEIVRSMEHKKLMLEFVAQTDHYFTFEYHEQFIEVLTSFDDALTGYVDAAIERSNKERYELIACVRALVSKHVIKFLFEIRKELAD
jgi:hypothetical protein